MTCYRLRFFFDAGAGAWAVDARMALDEEPE